MAPPRRETVPRPRLPCARRRRGEPGCERGRAGVCGRVDAGGAVAARGGVDQGRQGQRRRPAPRLGRRHQGWLGAGAPGARPARRRAAPRRRRAVRLPAPALPCWRPCAAFEDLWKLLLRPQLGAARCRRRGQQPRGGGVLAATLHLTRRIAICVTSRTLVARDTPCSRATWPRRGEGRSLQRVSTGAERR